MIWYVICMEIIRHSCYQWWMKSERRLRFSKYSPLSITFKIELDYSGFIIFLHQTWMNALVIKMYRHEFMRNSFPRSRYPNKELFTTASRKRAIKFTWSVCPQKCHVLLYKEDSDPIEWSSFNGLANLQGNKYTLIMW